jgi:hypothetical protein
MSMAWQLSPEDVKKLLALDSSVVTDFVNVRVVHKSLKRGRIVEVELRPKAAAIIHVDYEEGKASYNSFDFFVSFQFSDDFREHGEFQTRAIKLIEDAEKRRQNAEEERQGRLTREAEKQANDKKEQLQREEERTEFTGLMEKYCGEKKERYEAKSRLHHLLQRMDGGWQIGQKGSDYLIGESQFGIPETTELGRGC